MRRYALVVVGVLVLAAIACGGSSGAAPQPTVACTPKTFTGRGDDVIDLPVALRGCTKVTLKHDGERNFIVVPYDSANNRLSSLCNEIGPYNGTAKWDRRAASLEIDADGNWTITIQK